MKILFTTPVIEHPAAGGPQLRIENSIKSLAKISELYVVSRSTKENTGGEPAISFYKSLAHKFYLAPSVQILSSNRYIRKLQKIFRNFFSSELEKDVNYLLKIIEQNQIDIIWFGYGNISFDLIKLLKKNNQNIKIICDTDSVWSRYILRELPYETDQKRINKIKTEGLKKEKEEAEWVNICDITTAVSEIDAKYYRGLAFDQTKIMLFSNAIDLNLYADDREKMMILKNPNIYLAGSFWSKSPMEKAFRWFVEDVYPLIKKEIPDIHFYIIGRGSKEILHDINDNSISILGKVPSVLPYLCGADVAIVPLKFESGTRFKIMEAAACKVPIVSTELGAEGIPVTDGVNILIANKSNQFAKAIIRLVKNKEFADKIANNCFNLISQNNSIESLTLEAERIIKRLNK